MNSFSRRMMGLPATLAVLVAHDIAATIVAALDNGTGIRLQDMNAGAQFLTELARGNLMSDGRALGAAIQSNLIQANTPEQGMNLKYAYATPVGPGVGPGPVPSPAAPGTTTV